MKHSARISANAWSWVPTLYLAQGLPYVTAMTLAVIMYKRLGLGNAEIALLTGWLYLPWVIKPFWSPFIDLVRTKRWWVLAMELTLAVAFAALALAIPASMFVRMTLAAFWLTAFASATHDIASDGFYMLALDSHRQSVYVGIRSTFYRIAMVVGQGALVVVVGWIETGTGCIPLAWSVMFAILSALFLLFALWHSLALPRPAADAARTGSCGIVEISRGFGRAFASFFHKPGVWSAVAFMLLYRLPEAQLVKLISPFLLDSPQAGGLGLTTAQVGLVYGTVGVSALMIGGVAGGLLCARNGLRRWMMPMAWTMSLTCLTFVALSQMHSPSMAIIYACVALEQMGYGFGTAAYTLYLIYYASGRDATSHYAIATGLMALGMMLPGMAAGWIQEQMGYAWFFIFTTACCAVTIVVAALPKVDSAFGRK